MRRKIVQFNVIVDNDGGRYLYALCDDGSIWSQFRTNEGYVCAWALEVASDGGPGGPEGEAE